jgi:hypothetical protein
MVPDPDPVSDLEAQNDAIYKKFFNHLVFYLILEYLEWYFKVIVRLIRKKQKKNKKVSENIFLDLFSTFK